MYGLTSQVRRSAVSIPSNIAEGQGRTKVGEFKQCFEIARGSNFEVQTELELARELKFGDQRLLEEAENLSHEVGRMIYRLMHSI